MSFKNKFLETVNPFLKAWLDLQVVGASDLSDLYLRADLLDKPSFSDPTLPQGAEEYLRLDHPRLKELKANAEALAHPAAQHSQWSDQYVSGEIDLRYFRGDNAYLWQRRDRNTEGKHILTAYHIQSFDKFDLLRSLKEDNLFGAHVYRFNDDVIVSRDLLDSIVETYFLERHLGISKRPGFTVLDIGAGYGRLAHRMVEAFRTVAKYFCVDAVPESTFVSEYYLRFRGVDSRAKVIPLDDIETTLANNPVDLAVNVHSFSECSLASIEWWLDLLRKHGVRHFLLVPNADTHGGAKLLSKERDGQNLDMLSSIMSRGYKLIVREPKFKDPDIQRHGISPTYHYLFELSSVG